MRTYAFSFESVGFFSAVIPTNAAIQTVLHRVDYAGKDLSLIGTPDPLIVGGPEMLVR